MRRFILGFVLAAAGLICLRATEASAQAKPAKVIFAADDMKWEALKGGPPGVMTAKMRAVGTKGGYDGFNKFPAGFKAPLHSHTYDTKIVVIKGGYTYKGKIYGPGSYLFIPGGDKHESGGVEDSESIFYIEQPGPFDIKMVEGASDKK
jgi:hypothetical protein